MCDKKPKLHLVDVETDCAGRVDGDVQQQGMALGLQVVAQLLRQLLPWLLQEVNTSVIPTCDMHIRNAG